MKTKFYALLLAASVLSIASCKKDSDATGDLTSEIVGHYTNASDNTEIFVNKIDDSSVSITYSTGSGSGSYDLAFPKATMNSKNAFTIDTIDNSSQCYGTEVVFGTGTYSNNNISLFITAKGEGEGMPYNDCGDWSDNLSATKQ